jgi:hypothetical protein
MWDPVQNIPKPPADARPTTELIADEIYRHLQGRVLTRKDIYSWLADSLFFISEIDRALKLLKRQGKLLYAGSKLSHKTEMRFIPKSTELN